LFALVLLAGASSVVPSPYDVTRPLDPVNAATLLTSPKAPHSTIAFPIVDTHRAKWSEVAWYGTEGRGSLHRRSADSSSESTATEFGRLSVESLFGLTQAIAGFLAADEAGMHPVIRGDGVRVWALPKKRVPTPLKVGDVITAIDRESISTYEEFVTALGHHKPGQRVSIDVRKHGTERVQILPWLNDIDVALRPHYALGTSTVETERPQLKEPRIVWRDPPLHVQGTSAGLAMAMSAYEALSGVRCNRRVLATGSVASDGTVGMVGSVAEKALSADPHSFDAMLVPQRQTNAARDVPSGVKVVGVASVRDAIAFACSG
jgi:PDZ domain-containing secreted protein